MTLNVRPFFAPLALTAALACAQMAVAQEPAPDPVAAANETPIIVDGTRATEPPRAQTGSRIPGDARFTDLNVATSTGISGLSPGAGIEPFHGTNPVKRRVSSTCISDNEGIGERASCLFLQAERSIEQQDIIGAADIYRFLVSSDQFGPSERLAGGTQLFQLADETDDAAMQEEALIRLLASGSLPEDRQADARRTLVDMARSRGDKALAIERLEEHIAIGDPDAQSLANLAILRRETGRAGAQQMMRRAISAKEADDEEVPEGWRDFADNVPVAAVAEPSESSAASAPPAQFESVSVILATAMGDITIALETERAPITAGNFLRYVDEDRFDGIVFYRAMPLAWGDQPNGLLQGGTQWDPDRILPGIPHEPTTTTGLSHTRGALSMAMLEPGSANGDFSIMLGDQTGLDANPSSDDPVWRNGYAVFGYVTNGMDVVEAIHAAPVDPDKGEGWMKGQMLADPVVVIEARRAEAETETE